MVIIDWKPESILGPPKENRLTIEEVKEMAQKSNLNLYTLLKLTIHIGVLFFKNNICLNKG